MELRKLNSADQAPMELLLLADPSPKIVEEYLVRGQCYVADLEERIIGVYILLPTRPHTVELVNISVLEKYQGKGIGKQLVLDAINRAKLKGFRTIEIGTGNSSIRQLILYQKCGFRIVGIDIDFFVRNYSEAIYENGIQCRDMIRLTLNL